MHHLRWTPLEVFTSSPALLLYNSTCTTSSSQSHHYQVAVLVVTVIVVDPIVSFGCCREVRVMLSHNLCSVAVVVAGV